jgi:hypothetical protein
MSQKTTNELRETIRDINNEIARLTQLQGQIHQAQTEITKNPALSSLLYESLALKLHNFYTGCERIFQIIASELNGGLSSSYDWHRRLLIRMANPQAERPAVLTPETAKRLEEYLAFRHVVRNIYGFELDPRRLDNLLKNYDQTWSAFQQDIQQFLEWLSQLTEYLEPLS